MDAAPLSDEVLMRRYAGGDAKSFEALYERHELRVWRYLERSVHNAAIADELMQEVWFSVAREATRYQPSARFSTWLFTIAHNRMVDALRANRSQVSLEALGPEDDPAAVQLIDDPQHGPQALAVAYQQAEALNGAVEALSAEQREAFLLHVEGELTVDEIAVVTACSFETAKSRLRYARSKLRELLKEYV
ncbi:MAG: sigma-70 family RNA polymerase sigma factor [Steroidobacteraceae bacterium]